MVAVGKLRWIAECRVVVPQTDLGRELHLGALLARELHAEPGREVRDPRTREHRVGAGRDDPRREMARPPDRGAFPRIHRRVEIGRERRRVGAPRLGIGFRSQRGDALRAEPVDPLLLRLDVEDPVPDPLVVRLLAGPGGRPRVDPEVVVLAVTRHRDPAGIETTRMRAHRALDDREHEVSGDPRRAASAPHSPSRSGGWTTTLPSRSATSPCMRATSGTSGASNPTSPKGVSARAKASLSSIDEPAIDRVTIAGNPRAAASSRWENAKNDQCSTSTSPRSYAPANHGLGVKLGKVSPE
jgi:hypothetical protein